MRYVFLFLIFLVIGPSSSLAITEAKEKDIRILFKAMGLNSIISDAADASVVFVIGQEKQANPNLSKKAEYEISQAVHDITMADMADLEVLSVPIYDKYYTHEEIKQLTVFFDSPVGRKYSAVSSLMMQDLLLLGQQNSKKKKTGVKQARAVEEILKKYGYK